MDIRKLTVLLHALKNASESFPCTLTFMEMGECHDLAAPVCQASASFVCEENGWKKSYSASVLFFGDGKIYAYLVSRSANPEEGICADRLDKAWLESIDTEGIEEKEICEDDENLTWYGGYLHLMAMVLMSVSDSPDREKLEAKLESVMREEHKRLSVKPSDIQ